MFNVSIGKNTLQVRHWSSTSAAHAACPGLRVLNEDVPPGEPMYELRWLREVRSTYAEPIVGFQMESAFQSLSILGSEFGSFIWIGGNAHVLALSQALEVEARHDLDSQFAYFHTHPATNQLVVVAEAGVYALTQSGLIAWKQDLDLITAVTWRNGLAHFTQADGSVVAIDIAAGSRQ